MRELSRKLANVSGSSSDSELSEARQIIAKLRSMNLRWNVPELAEFIKSRQRELFLRRLNGGVEPRLTR